jgi:hypothetical protein
MMGNKYHVAQNNNVRQRNDTKHRSHVDVAPPSGTCQIDPSSM